MKTRFDSSAFVSIDLVVAVVMVLMILMLVLQIIPALNPPVPETNMKQILAATRTSDMLIGDPGRRDSYKDTYWEESWNAADYSNVSRIGFAFAESSQNISQNILNESKVNASMIKHSDNSSDPPWWESNQSVMDKALQPLGLSNYSFFYMQLRPLNESLFDKSKADENITIVPDGAAVVERYVFVRGPEGLVNASGKTLWYRLILWVW